MFFTIDPMINRGYVTTQVHSYTMIRHLQQRRTRFSPEPLSQDLMIFFYQQIFEFALGSFPKKSISGAFCLTEKFLILEY